MLPTTRRRRINLHTRVGLLQEMLDATPRDPRYNWRRVVIYNHLEMCATALHRQEQTQIAAFKMATQRAFGMGMN